MQMDNCSRENKNKYLLSYLDALVVWQVFDVVEAGFLPVGHTHCDIDQAFSSTSDRLRYHKTVTLSDLHNEISQCYNQFTQVSSMRQVANWSGLCDKLKCNNNVNFITQYRFFRFSRTTEGEGDNCSIVCHVRSTCTEEWRTLESDKNNKFTSILKFSPDLNLTPPEKQACPPDLDKFEQNLDSEKERIDSQAKMRSLLTLQREVYKDRTSRFHWTSDCLEMVDKTNNDMDTGDGVSDELVNTESSGFHYEIGSFVAVLTDSSSHGDEFWIGKITDVRKGRSNRIVSLCLHWFGNYGGTCLYISKYKPEMLLHKTLFWHRTDNLDYRFRNFSIFIFIPIERSQSADERGENRTQNGRLR